MKFPFKTILLLSFLTTSAFAQFWDHGLLDGHSRTELPIGKGTGSDLLAITYSADFDGAENCKFNAVDSFGCPARAGLPEIPHPSYPNDIPVWFGGHQTKVACNGDTTRGGDSWFGCALYDSSPYFETNLTNQSDNFWVLGANIEPAFDQCKDGPPNLSHQIQHYGSPNKDLFMFGSRSVILPNFSNKKVIKMGLHNSDHDYFCDINQAYELGNIPFFSFGAQKNRGNQTAVGSLASRHSGGLGRLRFKAQVIDYAPFSCPQNEFTDCPAPSADLAVGSHAGIFILVSWNDTTKGLFLDLFRSGIYENEDYHPPISSAKWNWPLEDSFYYPGAQFTNFESGQDITNSCGLTISKYEINAIEPQEFDIDISRLYECARDLGYYPDLPDTGIEIEGVHWFIETNGPKGELSIEIQDIFMGQDDLIYRDPF